MRKHDPFHTRRQSMVGPAIIIISAVLGIIVLGYFITDTVSHILGAVS